VVKTMKIPAGYKRNLRNVAAFGAVLLLTGAAAAAPDTATMSFETGEFRVMLQQNSQTLVSLAPKLAAGGFDFAPASHFAKRLGNGFYRLGDIDLRVRTAGETGWRDASTAFKREPVTPLADTAGVLAAADITASLGDDFPLRVSRQWTQSNGHLVLRFTLTNPGDKPVEIGGLGLPMIFDNIITGRELDQAHEQASYYDPYVGRDGGYLQVTRLNGAGPALLVLPEKDTPFELYKPILDQRGRNGDPKLFNDGEPRNMTFEGFYDWMVASKGFADKEWKGVVQWNEPTSLILKPGETRTIGVRFVLSPSIRQIEQTLVAEQRPVVVGVPGYILPADMAGALFVHAPQPVKSITTYPAGAVAIGTAKALQDGWQKYALTGKVRGRVRLTLTYADGSEQTVHYLVTKPEVEAVADMGRFLTTKQWFSDPADPFRRAPSVMGYDNEAKHIITQDSRVWVAGLSDEGGAGSWLAAAMKELDNPDPAEVAKLEAFANETLWGKIQVSEGSDKYGVHKSIYYYDPANMPAGTYDPALNWKTWAAWSKKDAADLGRSFNYPHVAAAWWTLYRLARFHDGLTMRQSWQTYLTRAAETIKAMMSKAPYYTQFGQMEGDVFVAILGDLKREGMTGEADAIEALMKGRADHWNTLKYPFGSEMPWDSTGQPEVYAWMRYFGHDDKADTTREVILGYDPAIPHWGYNGSARRFWDFLYAGKVQRIERQLHHYGSANNALPLFDSYRRNPEDFYLLRVAYGGLMGSLSNIDDEGFASAAFHSFPDMMKFDAINGDYGSSFFAHAYSAASYLVDHPVFGWLGFGGDVSQNASAVTLQPKDSARTRTYIAPAKLWITLSAGKIESVTYDSVSRAVKLFLAPRDAATPTAYLSFEGDGYRLASAAKQERGLYAVALGQGTTMVELSLPGVTPGPDQHKKTVRKPRR